MELIADILLGAGALGVAAYCHVLSRRLRAFNQLENGIGGAVAVLSAQVDDLTRTLTEARQAARESSTSLAEKSERAEKASAKLELMLATLHDLPEEGSAGGGKRRIVRRRSTAYEEAGEAA
jgi:hypothetical protein